MDDDDNPIFDFKLRDREDIDRLQTQVAEPSAAMEFVLDRVASIRHESWCLHCQDHGLVLQVPLVTRGLLKCEMCGAERGKT